MSLDLSAPDDAPEVDLSAHDPSLLERIQTLETRAADASAVDEIATRLDRIETRLARPSARIEVRENDDEIERRAFNNFLRLGMDRLADHDKHVMADIERKVLSVGGPGSPELGGANLVPEFFVREIIRNLVLVSPMRQIARVQTVSSTPVLLPKRTTNLAAAWVAETAQHGADEPTFVQLSIPVFEARVTSEVSNQLLEDSAFDLAAELARDMALEFARLEGQAFMTGNGTSQPFGILADSSFTSTITTGTGVLNADNIIDLFHAVPSIYAQNGTWLMTRATMGTVRKSKTSGTGVYLWTESLQPGNPPSILGRPVVEMPGLTLAASPQVQVIAFGDWSAYRIFDRVGLDILRDPYSRARNSVVAFHARKRVGGALANAEAVRGFQTA